jgi:phage gp36-like protein
MPVYATHDDMVNRHGNDAVTVTFDRDGDGMLDSAAESAALADASNEIDGYLAGVYTLPLATVPPLLVLYCCDIAIYRGAQGAVVTEEIRKRFEDAIKFLTMLAQGKIKLFANDPSAPNGGSGASFDAGERIFTRSRTRDMR